MNAIHYCEILCNGLSMDNIMLQFSKNKPNVVYIGVCNWDEVVRLQEVMTSLDGFVQRESPHLSYQ